MAHHAALRAGGCGIKIRGQQARRRRRNDRVWLGCRTDLRMQCEFETFAFRRAFLDEVGMLDAFFDRRDVAQTCRRRPRFQADALQRGPGVRDIGTQLLFGTGSWIPGYDIQPMG